MLHLILVGGLSPSEKYESQDYEIPNIWKLIVPNHQPEKIQ
jgi:hypothetical protein